MGQSIHPSIFFRLSGAGSRGQQSKQRCPDFPLPSHFLQLFRGDTEAFPGQPGDIVSPACPRSSPGPPPGGTRPKHLPGKASRRHLEQMPEPPQLTPLDVEEQRLYSELLPSDWASHPISKGAPSHPTEKANFGRLYPGSCPFGHDPKLMTIGESRNVDWPVNRELRLAAQLFLHHDRPVHCHRGVSWLPRWLQPGWWTRPPPSPQPLLPQWKTWRRDWGDPRSIPSTVRRHPQLRSTAAHLHCKQHWWGTASPSWSAGRFARWWSVDSSAPLFTRVSKTYGRRSDETTTKSIIDLRPRVSWCHVHWWTPLCLNMVFVMDKL